MEKLLPMLPDLRDPQKIDAAVEQLLAAVQRKEALLMGYPSVVALDGTRGVNEAIVENRYATTFEPPTDNPGCAKSPPPAPKESSLVDDSAIPSSFETRNSGVTLEVEPHVSAAGEKIRLSICPPRTELVGFESYESAKTESGRKIKIDQPKFSVVKDTSVLTVANGQQVLFAVHLLAKPENYMEVFIVQATTGRGR